MLINVLLLSATFSSLLLGLLIYIKSPKIPSNLFYFLFSLFLASWSFGMWMYAKDPFIYDRVLTWSKILHATGILVALFLLLFSLTFPKNISLPFRKATLIAMPALLMAIITLFTNYVIKSVNYLPGNRQLVYSSGYFLYFLFFATYLMTSLLILIKKYFKSKGIEKQQIKYIAGSITIASILSFIINMILPALGNFKIAWLGPLVIFIILVAIGYAITKHHLFDIKVIIT